MSAFCSFQCPSAVAHCISQITSCCSSSARSHTQFQSSFPPLPCQEAAHPSLGQWMVPLRRLLECPCAASDSSPPVHHSQFFQLSMTHQIHSLTSLSSFFVFRGRGISFVLVV